MGLVQSILGGAVAPARTIMSFIVRKGIKFFTNTSGPHNANPPNITEVNSSVWEFCSRQRPDVDIIFFHGLQLGDYEDAFWKTWRAKDDEQVVWPKDWLSKKLPNARIFSISYNSSATRSQGQLDMELLGENLVSDIIDDRITNIGQNCPVFLVGHSLGGIVIKQFLLSAKQKFDLYEQDGNYQGSRDRISTFLHNFKGVFYYATPHGGSPVADSNLTDFAGKLMGTSYILKFLQTVNSTVRERINNSFERHRRNLRHLRACAVAEGLDTKYKGFSTRVVPEASAFRDFDVQYMHSKADHFTVCQAIDENDPIVIEKLVRFILGDNPDGSIASIPPRGNDEDLR